MKRKTFTDYINDRIKKTGEKKTALLEMLAEKAGLTPRAFFFKMTTAKDNRDHHQVLEHDNGSIEIITVFHKLSAKDVRHKK